MSVFIEGIELEHFSESHHPSTILESDHVSRYAVFHFPPSDYRKQDAATTYEHSKLINEMLQNIIVLFSGMSTVDPA